MIEEEFLSADHRRLAVSLNNRGALLMDQVIRASRLQGVFAVICKGCRKSRIDKRAGTRLRSLEMT